MKTASQVMDWSLRNDQIVLRVMGGSTLDEAAAEFGLKRRQVSNIVNDPRAKEIIAVARERLREKLLEGIDDQLDLAAQASLKVLKRTVEADISPLHKAKSNQDRVALKLLEGRGFLSKIGDNENQGYNVTPEQFDRLIGALAKSDAAKAIDPFEKVREGAIEVPFKEIKAGSEAEEEPVYLREHLG